MNSNDGANTTSTPSRDASHAMKITGGFAALGGWALGMYAGFDLLLPLVATTLVWLIARKWFDEARQPVLPAFSVQAGHLIAFAAVVVMTRRFDAVFIDMGCLIVGLAWLCLRPGKGPLWFLALYQLLSLPYNVFMFTQVAWGSADNKALLVNMVWRGLALFYMGRLYFQMERQQQRVQADF